MRQVYVIASTEDALDKIRGFLLSTGAYTSEVDKTEKTYSANDIPQFRGGYTYFVVRNTQYGTYLIFFKHDDKYIHVIACTEYDDSKEIFYQKGSIVKDTLKYVDSGNLNKEIDTQRNQYHTCQHFPCLRLIDWCVTLTQVIM